MKKTLQELLLALSLSLPEIAFAVRFWDGDESAFGNGPPVFTIVFTTEDGAKTIFTRGPTGFREQYVAGNIEVEGDLEQLLRLGMDPKVQDMKLSFKTRAAVLLQQFRLIACITFNIPHEFGRPIAQICSRLMCGSALVGVPKASMHQDGLVPSRKNNIGLTRQLRIVQTVTIPSRYSSWRTINSGVVSLLRIRRIFSLRLIGSDFEVRRRFGLVLIGDISFIPIWDERRSDVRRGGIPLLPAQRTGAHKLHPAVPSHRTLYNRD